jgi:hypothetical protein
LSGIGFGGHCIGCCRRVGVVWLVLLL